MQTYPLPPTYCGVEHVILLDHVITATVLSIPELNHGPLMMDVTLEPDHFSKGWKVRSPFGIIGFLDETESAEFPDLNRLRACGAQPTTWATAEIIDNSLEVAIHLGMWVWHVPRNNQPEGSVLLTGGKGFLVDSSTSQDLDEFQLASLGARQMIVTLHVVGDHIAASLEDYVLGQVCTTAEAPEVTLILNQCAEQGVEVCARAYSAGSIVAIDLPPAGTQEYFSSNLPPLAIPHEEPVIPPRESELPDPSVTEVTLAALPATSETPVPSGQRPIIGFSATQGTPEEFGDTEEETAEETAEEVKVDKEITAASSQDPAPASASAPALPPNPAPRRPGREVEALRERREARARRRHGRHRK